jgi:hypothetical protein
MINKTIEFIEKSKRIHGEKYDYSLSEYMGARSKIKIICKEHGEFEQRIDHHLSGHGCSKCGGSEKFSLENIILEFKKIHGNKYNYSLVEYKNNDTKIKIICKEHGIFEQKPRVHLSGSGCPICI